MSVDAPLDELQWRSPEWVNMFGLRTDNVLEYFSQSPFFDRSSNNQVIKMQSQFTEQNFINKPYDEILIELKKMKGIEFVLALVKEPDFWIIRKQNRLNESVTQTIADYYIIGSSVYMAPLVSSIMSSRLLSSMLSLKKAMNILQNLSTFSPSDGHGYNLGDNSGISGINTNNTSASNTNGTNTNALTTRQQSTVNLAKLATLNSTSKFSSSASSSAATTNRTNGTNDNNNITDKPTDSNVFNEFTSPINTSDSIPISATHTFNNLLNISIANNIAYLDTATVNDSATGGGAGGSLKMEQSTSQSTITNNNNNNNANINNNK
ncbi:hypothetical protein BVG19_g1057 [[Candida] boidinii]|nr:hypothetical protein BVG19_g1057 [[Candida] boidinii]OWB50666.1 hypothetical protein B5S27_g2218 [[Candida] boidinii]